MCSVVSSSVEGPLELQETLQILHLSYIGSDDDDLLHK